jgi:hypothetical protein
MRKIYTPFMDNAPMVGLKPENPADFANPTDTTLSVGCIYTSSST